MADSAAIRAGRAFVEAFLDSGPLNRQLAQATAKIAAWGQGINAIGKKLFLAGGIATGGLLKSAEIFAEMGSALNDAAQRTGFAVEELGALKFAVEQAGASFEDLEIAIKFMQKGGFGKSAEDLLKIGDRIAAMENPADRTRKAMEIFGRSGEKMLSPIMNGLRKTTQEARELGLVMTAADAAAADKLGDAFDALKSSLKIVVATIGGALSPMLMELMAQVRPIVVSTVQWVRENRGLVTSLFQAAAATAAAGLGLMLIGKTVSGLMGAAGMIGKLFSGSFAVIVAGVKLAVAAFGLLLSPIGIVAVAVGGLLAAWLLFTEEGNNTVNALGQAWDQISSIALGAWKGIVDAVMSGDLALAAQIAWAGLKAAWAAGIAALQLGWIEFTSSLESSWIGAMAVLKDAWANFILGAKLLWTDLKSDFLKGLEVIKFKLGMITKEQGAASVADIDKQAKQSKDTAIADRDAKNVAIGEEFRRRQTALAAEKQDRLAGIGKEAQAAREELNKVVKEAADKRAAQTSAVAKGVEQKKPGGGMGEVGAGVGTFSAAGALTMGGNTGVIGRLDKQIKGQEQTNDLLERLLNTGGGGLAFK